VLLAGLLLLGVCGVRRRQRTAGVFTLLLSSLLLIGLSACSSGTGGGTGGGGNSGGPANPNATPPGVYAITITATSGGATRTTIVNVTVTSS
jgi:hypothetical protein